MVNAKLDPQELPENTLQVSINNNNNNNNKNNNSEAEHYIKRNPHAKNNSKDLLLKVMVVLNIFLDLLNLQLDISKNDLRMLQKDFFVKVTRSRSAFGMIEHNQKQ